jgi:hypothetical protein
VNILFVVVAMVRVSPPPITYLFPVTESAEFADETVPVATEARVVKPPVCVKYASCEIAMSEEVAMSSLLLVEMVTFPVAPDTEMPEPAMLERTPVLVNEVPSYERPVPAVVVDCHVGTPDTKASTCPLVPAEVVAILPVPLPKRTVLAWRLLHPVPPLVAGRMPETWVARSRRPEMVAKVEVAAL